MLNLVRFLIFVQGDLAEVTGSFHSIIFISNIDFLFAQLKKQAFFC